MDEISYDTAEELLFCEEGGRRATKLVIKKSINEGLN